MSRIGNLTRLIYTYIRTRQCLIQYTGDLHIPDIHILYFIRQCVVQYTRDLHIPEHTYFIRHCLVQYTMLHIPDKVKILLYCSLCFFVVAVAFSTSYVRLSLLSGEYLLHFPFG